LWAYREKLVQTGATESLFQNFHERLLAQRLITKTGTLVDATFVTVPRQRNTREENASIKSGATTGDWKERSEKLRQKDLEARWTLKNHVATYGYKNHVKVDAASKLIIAQKVTPANANDGRHWPIWCERTIKPSSLIAPTKLPPTGLCSNSLI
jgi:transposase, IS5 family